MALELVHTGLHCGLFLKLVLVRFAFEARTHGRGLWFVLEAADYRSFFGDGAVWTCLVPGGAEADLSHIGNVWGKFL